MGKYSSHQSKQKHNEKTLSKNIRRNLLLTHSYHDNQLNEIVYTQQTAITVLNKMKEQVGYTQNDIFPELGEVLTWPGGESPTINN